MASTRDLQEAGLDDRVLTTSVRSGFLERIRRGAYARSEDWEGLSPWIRDEYRIEAHAAGTGGRAVYSHTSAARLHGFATWGVGSTVHIIGSTNSGTSHAPDTATHRVPLEDAEIVMVRTRGGRLVRATEPVRTVLDCARTLLPERAAVIGDSALRGGVMLGDLESALEASPIVRGGARAARLLRLLDARAESAGETRTRLLLSRLGVEPPETQVCIETPHGSYRADFGWRRFKLILEFDGRGKYFDYRPTPEVLLLERRREAALIELGWRFVRLVWSDLEHPELVGARLAAAFAAAA
ncbi:hypothetical protein [Sinomonas humi]|uniref:hypothetical protein n=1 Tax=Sinomonas humi TaxID=1338436 RepID=UPI00068A1674|nr:hypothetical protein [Sinomonas humi]